MTPGWKFAGEAATSQMFISSLQIVFSVVVIMSASSKPEEKQPQPLKTA